MTAPDPRSAARPPPDEVLTEIADYVTAEPGAAPASDAAYETARWCLLDTLGCGLLALSQPACARRVGPVVPGAVLAGGARVPGTPYALDPVRAAFATGCAVRWLDFNDTWLAAEWGHPSDNLGGILAAADWAGRSGRGPHLAVRELLGAMVQAHEIQGVLALENAFNRVGLDHVILVRAATTAVVTALLGGSRDQVVNALSNAWLDGGALRTYRHAPNTGPRKSWAAGDATSRGVWHALLALQGEMGYPSALTAPTWGLQDVLLGGTPLRLARPLGSYVMENVLFKVSFPAEFHAQTAVECAFRLHDEVRDRIEDIEEVRITTQEPARRIIDKTGPLHNPADRDHCLQYMTAVGLIFGELTERHYEDGAARDPRIDRLRERTTVIEEPRYTRDYLDPEKRSIANAVEVRFAGGRRAGPVAIEYPLGHPRRRAEALPHLRAKARRGLAARLPGPRADALLELFDDPTRLEHTEVEELVGLLVTEDAP